MTIWRLFTTATAASAILWAAALASAEEVRYFEEGGVTYRETRTTVRHPAAAAVPQPASQTVYSEQLRTEYQNTIRVYSVPVTEYRWETYMAGRWNPFAQPHQAQRLVPYTRWQTRSENVQVPVARRELVAQSIQQPLPVVAQQFPDQVQITRVAVSSQAVDPAAIASRQPTSAAAVNSAAQLKQWPGSTPNDAGWRPVTIATRPVSGAVWR